MSPRVIHQPRVAYDTARAIVSIAAIDDDELLIWFATNLGDLLGPDTRLALLDTRRRLRQADQPDRPFIETGQWRVRLEDLFREHPDLTEDAYLLTMRTATRLSRH